MVNSLLLREDDVCLLTFDSSNVEIIFMTPRLYAYVSRCVCVCVCVCVRGHRSAPPQNYNYHIEETLRHRERVNFFVSS